jgi:STE24 endopeptidase
MTDQMFSTLFVSLFILKTIVKLWLDLINLWRLKKQAGVVPAQLQSLIDAESLLKNDSYHTAKMYFQIICFLFNSLIIAVILFTPAYRHYSNWTFNWPVPVIVKGIGFFIIPELIDSLIQLPFSFIYHFRIEARYGFNKYRISGWLTDTLKSLLVNIVLTVLILAVILGIWGNSFNFNWRDVLLGWLLALILIITFVYLVPVLLIPFFYKLRPLPNEELQTKIKDLVERAGFKARGVFMADQSQKSTHANASISGLGKSKTIILFDTLVDNYDSEEILGVLAHEIGHGKMGHIQKLLITIIFQAFLFIWAASYLLETGLPYSFAGIPNIFYSGLFITYYFFFELLGYFISPIMAAISRRFEYQADAFSKRLLGSGAPLIATFEKFITRELVNLNSHPLYESFYYSHPTLLKRIKALRRQD